MTDLYQKRNLTIRNVVHAALLGHRRMRPAVRDLVDWLKGIIQNLKFPTKRASKLKPIEALAHE